LTHAKAPDHRPGLKPGRSVDGEGLGSGNIHGYVRQQFGSATRGVDLSFVKTFEKSGNFS
jgi:hypothetical protein